MKLIILILLVLFLSFTGFSQTSLPMPRKFIELYQGNTRTWSGDPGSEYWQNHADYDIQVSLEPKKGTISGTASIDYFNESPDTLTFLVVKLLPDLWKKGNWRDLKLSPKDIHEGVEISELSLSLGLKEKNRTGTILVLAFEQPLLPEATVNLKLKWNYPLPDLIPERGGIYDPDEFFVSYWYPQIAVYDDATGWDAASYTGMVETYNDFSNYKVDVTVPQGFVVWATGELQNPEQVLNNNILQKFNRARNSAEIVKIIAPEDLKNGKITAKAKSLTYSFRADAVMDFAFAASNHYLWDGTSLELENRSVFISAAYDTASRDFYEVADISRKSIDYFSREMPAIPYPYPVMTVFNGGGGMEFPMMVNDASTTPGRSVVSLTSHEIAHSYFPFYMGTNERKYAFMDEGWAMKLPFGIQNRLVPDYDPIERTVTTYENFAGSEWEIPMMTPTLAINGQVNYPVYRNSAYYKPGTAYHMLHLLLGDEVFMKALHTYMDRWHGKHPLPYDFFFTFDEVAGEDLSWFWHSWFFTTQYPDLGIADVLQNDEQTIIKIEKVGDLPIPVRLELNFVDGSTEFVEESMKVWKDGKEFLTLKLPFTKKLQSVELGNSHIPDSNQDNNSFTLN